MTAGVVVGAALLPLAVWLALAPLSDLLAWIVGWFRVSATRQPIIAPEALLFLVPAHNEELLIARCVNSLMHMTYPEERRAIVVIADNCTDRTASLAAQHGARVLERTSTVGGGKGDAVGWALETVDLEPFAAVVVIDADTVVEPTYASEIGRWGPLRNKALQTYDGLSNEFENALTRMAGLLTRNRYGTTLRVKSRAGLNCPMTGDGIVLGTELLRRFPWNVATVTEGWELYARLTLAGEAVEYAAEARLYAQEASSLTTSHSQRQRWASGRLAVLRGSFQRILTAPHIKLLQRLDLVAELSNLGPVTHSAIGIAAAIVAVVAQPPGVMALTAMLSAPVVHQFVMSLISLRRHPEPMRTVAAFVGLPRYAFWRLGVALGALSRTGAREWVRTERH